MADVLGLADARFAAEVAAAGGHHLLLSGPKGCGKTTLAERIPSILPDLTIEESIEVTALHSLAGALEEGDRLIVAAPVLRTPPRRQQGQHHRRRHRSRTTGRGEPGPLRGAAPRRVPAAAHRRDRRPPATARERRRDDRPGGRRGDLSRAGHWSCSPPTRARAATIESPAAATAAAAARRNARTTGAGCAGRSPTGSTSPATSSRCGPTTSTTRGRAPSRRRWCGSGWPPLAPARPSATRGGAGGSTARRRDRRWPSSGRCSPEAQQVIDDRMYAGKLSRRGAIRVHRIAWTVADLRGAEAPSVADAGTALRLRTGEPLLLLGAAAGRLVIDDRVARAGLSRLAEPGDTRVPAAVGHVGAITLFQDVLARQGDHERASGGRTGPRLVDDTAPRLLDLDPAADLERAERLGHPVRGPRRRRVAHPARRPGPLRDGPGAGRRADRALGPRPDAPRRARRVGGGRRVAFVDHLRRGRRPGDRGRARPGGTAPRLGRRLRDRPGVPPRAPWRPVAPSVAVLACGVDRAYPTAHRDLLDHLAATGAVVSELPPGCAPTRMRFLARNRVIAALTRGTVLVEAARPQRRPQHRALGDEPVAAADGRARPGHERPVAGGPPPPPHGRVAGDRSGRRARAGGRRGPRPARGAARPRAPARPAAAAPPPGPGGGAAPRCRPAWRRSRPRPAWRSSRPSGRWPTSPSATSSSRRGRGGDSATERSPTSGDRADDGHTIPAWAPTSRAAPRTRCPRRSRRSSPTTSATSSPSVTPRPTPSAAISVTWPGCSQHADRLGISSLDELDLRTLRSWLANQQTRGKARTTLARRATAARVFTAWLARTGRVPVDPGASLGSPKAHRTLPSVLRADEARALVEAAARLADDGSPTGLRDVAMLELLYATGVRVGELVGLDVDDLDRERQVLRVLGKGRKERTVPYGRPAAAALDRWLALGRPALLVEGAGGALFLGARGRRIDQRAVRTLVHRRIADVPGRARPRSPRAPPHRGDPPARGGRRPALGAGAAGPRLPRHDAALHPRHHRPAPEGLPAGPPPRLTDRLRARAGPRRRAASTRRTARSAAAARRAAAPPPSDGQAGQGQQPHRPAPDEAQRVEVGLAADPAPVEAGAGEAVGAHHAQGADHGARRDRRAAGEGGRDRLVGGAGAAVGDGDHRPAGDGAGEGDPAGQRRADRLPGLPGQVDAPVARPPRRLRGVEPARPPRARAAAATGPPGRSPAPAGRGTRERPRDDGGGSEHGRAGGRRVVMRPPCGRGRGWARRPAPAVEELVRGRPCGRLVAADRRAGRIRRPAWRSTILSGAARPVRADFARSQTTTECIPGSDRPWASILGPDQLVGSDRA